MTVRNRFEYMIEEVLRNPKKKKCAVVCADKDTTEAALQAEDMGLIEAVFFSVEQTRDGRPTNSSYYATPAEAAMNAVSQVHSGALDMILKGNIDTAVLLKEVVNKSYGLHTGKLISHVALLDVPTYHKILLLTDGGMVTYPDRKQLREILENAVEVMHRLGVAVPKVACLAAVEKVHDRMPETLNAKYLKDMNLKGDIEGCIVEGPISFDLAYDRQSAVIKHYESPVAGDADILLVPDFVSGNILTKALVYGGRARTAGFLTGARAPVIVTSRSTSIKEKIYSIACSAIVSA